MDTNAVDNIREATTVDTNTVGKPQLWTPPGGTVTEWGSCRYVLALLGRPGLRYLSTLTRWRTLGWLGVEPTPSLLVDTTEAHAVDTTPTQLAEITLNQFVDTLVSQLVDSTATQLVNTTPTKMVDTTETQLVETLINSVGCH